MKETRLWRQLAPCLLRFGKFQKISDRFTGGVSDVLGCQLPAGRACAFELKEFYLRRGLVVADFRPGQIPFLQDWGKAGGLALVVGTLGRQVAAFDWRDAQALQDGVSGLSAALVVEPTGAWKAFVGRVLGLDGATGHSGSLVQPVRQENGPSRSPCRPGSRRRLT